jgi:hypothetical protein
LKGWGLRPSPDNRKGKKMTTTKVRIKELPEDAIAPWKPWWLYHFDTPDGHFEIVARDWVSQDGKDLGSTVCIMQEVPDEADSDRSLYNKVSDYFEDDQDAIAYAVERYGVQPIENK